MLCRTHSWASVVFPELGLYTIAPLLLTAVGLGALLLPNTFEISRYVRRFSYGRGDRSWANAAVPTFLIAFFLYFAVTSISKQQSTFLYYNF
jgi:hypothetical protein